MPSFCVVSNCELKYCHSENISFHKFPVNNPKILDLWIKFTGRGTVWKPSRWSSICSRHFNKSDFRDTEFLSRKCLKKNAVPTIITRNSISFETYHILNDPTNYYNNAPALPLNNETVEYGAISEARNYCSNEKTLFQMTCRLCGKRVNQFHEDNQVPQSLDDFGIDTMIKKCLPTMILSSDNDQSRVICGGCNSQLKLYSKFVDQVQSYQKDLIYSNCQNYVETNNYNRTSTTDILPDSSNSTFIKQEPTVNVKQEKSDGFNNNRRPKDLFKNVHSTYTMPSNHEATKLIRPMDANSAESLNAEYSEKRTGNEREQMGNCEIMEIITLNNPVSFIDLAAEDDPTGHADFTKILKTESLLTSDIDRRVEVEHAYAKRVHQPGGTVHELKQEISENIYDDLNENTGHVLNDSISNEVNRPANQTESQIPDSTLTPEINMKCQSIYDHQEYSPPTLMKRECSFCDSVFESVTEYLRHKTKIHRSAACRRCNRKFNSNLFLKNHERHCNKQSKSIDNNYLNRRRKGMRTHKEISKDKSKEQNGISDYSAVNKTSAVYACDLGKFVCSFCYRLFKRAKNFVDHHEMHIKYNHQKDPKKMFTNQLLLSERDVKGNSLSNTILPRNLKTLRMVVKNVQVICMNYSDLNQLNRREVSLRCDETLTDTQAKFIFCSLCPNSHPNKFKTISGLKQHISGFHYKIKPYFCSTCGASFSLKSDSFRCRHSKSLLAKNNDNLFNIQKYV